MAKYYWLKLQKDFFKRHDIRIVESMQNGKDYILFYLKLLVESVSHEGELRFSDAIPYDENMLATITNTNVDVVRSAMSIFQRLNMIEILTDETIYMVEVQKMIGSECESARRVREHRRMTKALETVDSVETVDKALHCNANVTKCNTEIDKELEIEKDNIVSKDTIRKTVPTEVLQECISAWNSLSNLGIAQVSRLSSTSQRYKKLKSRIVEYGVDDYNKAIENIRHSSFLHGKNRQGWQITFDWFVSPNNFPKVLDGNYLDKGYNPGNTEDDDEGWQ